MTEPAIPSVHTRGRLFSKYAAYFAGLVSLLLVASGALAAYFSYRESVLALQALQQEKAQAAAVQIQLFLAGIEKPLRWTLTDFEAGEATARGETRLELVRLLRRLPPVSKLHWLDEHGREQIFVSRFDLDTAGSGRDFSTDPQVARARVNGADIGTVHFNRETEPTVSLAVSAAGRPAPALLASVNLKFVWDVITRLRVSEAGLAYLTDAQGTLISHQDISLVLRRADFAALPQVRHALAAARPTGVAEGANPLNQPVLSAYAVIPQSGWILFVEQPRAEAMAPAFRVLVRSGVMLLLGVLISIGVGLMLARKLVRPIRALEAGALEFGAGRLDRRIEVDTDDELQSLAGRFNDMAERLREIHSTLETRIDERTRELHVANQAKSRFLAAASHDLRQPMHALSLFVGQLALRARDRATRQLVAQIAQSVAALEELLDALLDISRLDAESIEPARQPVPLMQVFLRLKAQCAPLAQEKGLKLRVAPTSLWVETDPMLLERILLNLMVNAVRYTERGGILLGARRHKEGVCILVADSGCGIAQDDLPLIFQEFYQAGNPERDRSKGIGLGLAIVQRLTQLLGHRIEVRSRPGHGTTFTLRVPRVAARFEAALPGPASLGPSLRGRSLLAIDDDPAVRDALAGLLADWGMDVRVAADAGQADALLTNGVRPDVLLCDLRLRGTEDGIALLDRLRASHGRDLPAVLVTGDTAPERVQAVQASGYALLFKPVKPAKLRALLEHLLEPRP